MRGVSLAVIIALGTAGVLSAGEKETELLDKAIKAHGGADALTKSQTAIRNAQGTLTFGENTTNFTDRLTLALPDRWRYEGLVGASRVLIVFNKDKAWNSTGGMANEVTDKALAEIKDVAYLTYLQTIVPLKSDRFTLAVAAEEQVNGKKALGLRVSSKGGPDAVMYFDAETSLLVKILVAEASQGGAKVKKEIYYTDHKEFGGVKLPTRQTEYLNGKKYSDVKEASYRFQDKVDDKLFQKP